jgi:ferredoxin-type protein NapG
MPPASDRRAFVARGLSRLLGQAAGAVTERLAPTVYIRPPGALPEPGFLAACTRCGECIRACPAEAIVTLGAEHGLAGGTPTLDPARNACLMCPDMPCAVACPTEALGVPADGWASVGIGVAEIGSDRCIAHRGVTCGVCARVCPVGERALRLDRSGRPVLAEGCTGCGACAVACVTVPSSITIRVAREVA